MTAAAPGPGNDVRHMRHALALGRRALGATWPNPAVGCVLVAPDGRVLARGVTGAGGRPHAEAVALERAGAAARGATAFVTLEPCAHHGRTPPCAEALVAAGVARVVVPIRDPDPRVAGRGLGMLRAAGIEVTEGVCAEEAERDHAGFLMRVRAGRPLVTLKLAASLDGRIATASGESRWITGPASRRRVHLMRAQHDAVMVGIGTALADDPMLDVRDLGIARAPVRVVIDSRLRLPTTSRLGRSLERAPLWLVHGPAAPEGARVAWRRAGARLVEVPAGPGGGLDLAAALAALGAAGLTRVLCEGGGQLAAGLIGAGLADRLAVFHAGLALGAEGRPMIGPLAPGPLAEAPRWRRVAVEAVGEDVLSLWERAPAGA